MRVLEMMYQSKSGTTHTQMSMIHLKTFIQNLKLLFNRHAPLKKLSSKEIKLKNKPWLSPEVFKMITLKNKVFARKKGNPIMRTVNFYITYYEIELIGNLKNQRKIIMQIITRNMLIT